MGKLKALDENLNLTNKRIILRIDLNVPMQEGKVTDKSRITKVIPIIKTITTKKTKVTKKQNKKTKTKTKTNKKIRRA